MPALKPEPRSTQPEAPRTVLRNVALVNLIHERAKAAGRLTPDGRLVLATTKKSGK